MSHKSGSEPRAVPVAIVGKSPLFPACSSAKIFWPNVLGLDGVMVGLATSQWPFSEFFSEQDLKNLKGFVMTSGLLTGDGLPADGFEFPPEVLKISDVLPVLALFLARLSLEECQTFKDGKIPHETIKVILGSASDRHQTATKLAGMLHKEFGFSVSSPDANAPVNGTCGLLAQAVRELQKSTANLAIVGWTDMPNPIFATLDALNSDVSGASEKKLSEGIGMVVLRRLDEARRDGDKILAVINDADATSLTVLVESAPTTSHSSATASTPATTAGSAQTSAQTTSADPALITGLANLLGRFAPLSPAKRRAFLHDRRYVQGAAITALGPEESRLSLTDLRSADWLPGTVSRLYGHEGSEKELARQVALVDHLSQFARLHPADIVYDDKAGSCLNLPFNPMSVTLEESADQVTARGAFPPNLAWKMVRDRWVKWTGGSRRFFHDLLGLLFGTFVNRVVLHKPAEFEAVASKPVIYLANHQIGLESPLFMALAYAMTGLPIQAVAKPDHVNAWLDFLLTFAQDSLGDNQPFKLMFFDRLQPQGLIDTLKKDGGQTDSLLVHIEGTRAMEAGQPVTKVSSIFLDMAIEKNIPMVPVRFVGGLPQKQITERLDFPYGNGKQDYILGAPILPETLKKMPYGQRPRYVLDQINSLGPLNDEDTPLPPNKKFEEKTKFFMTNFAFPKMQAMLFAILGFIDDPCEETGFLLKMVQSGKLDGKTPGMPPTLGKFLLHVKTKFT